MAAMYGAVSDNDNKPLRSSFFLQAVSWARMSPRRKSKTGAPLVAAPPLGLALGKDYSAVAISFAGCAGVTFS